MKVRLPKRGINVEDLRCKKCGKTIKECNPKDCKDEQCPYKQSKPE